MAKGQTVSKSTTVNNMPATTATKTVELVVKNDQLVPDNNDLNPGVNSATNKNG